MKEKLYRFMQGRYGNDTLNNVVMVLCLIFLVANIFVRNIVLEIIGLAFWGIALYRMLSRNTYQRYQENERFMQWIAPITRYQTLHQKRKQDPSHKYYRCPSCHQIVRLPKGHGKVIVTCPKCQKQFEKRT